MYLYPVFINLYVQTDQNVSYSDSSIPGGGPVGGGPIGGGVKGGWFGGCIGGCILDCKMDAGGGGVVGGGPNNEDTVCSLLRFSTSSTFSIGLRFGGGGIFLMKAGVTSCTTNRDMISVRTFKISSVVGIPGKVQNKQNGQQTKVNKGPKG